jgi:hypothetical protein
MMRKQNAHRTLVAFYGRCEDGAVEGGLKEVLMFSLVLFLL